LELLTAAMDGDRAVVPQMLAAGTDPNTSVPWKNPSGEVVQTTVLCVAAGCGRLGGGGGGGCGTVAPTPPTPQKF
jgi:hypothetical protein